MSRTILSLSLPDPLRGFMEWRTRDGGYSSTSEYLRELIRADQYRCMREDGSLRSMQSGKFALARIKTIDLTRDGFR